MVAGLTLTSASSVAHDLYANVWKKGKVSEKQEVKVAKISAFVIGGVAIALAIPAQKLNIAFLVALAFAVAASANLPRCSTTCSGSGSTRGERPGRSTVA